MGTVDLPCPSIGDPSLAKQLVTDPSFCSLDCVVSGPTYTPNPDGTAKCCYVGVIVCEGRPLFVGGALRVATLARGAAWA